MNGKLTLDTAKKLLLNNGLLLLAYLVVQTVTTFAGNEYIVLPSNVEAALQLISIVLFALCIAAITISLCRTAVDLFGGKSYKYYSLPYKKSEIIFSKAIPAIIIESLIIALLLSDDLQMLILLAFNKEVYSGAFRSEMLNEWALCFLNSFVACLMIAATIGFLILLALIISRSFDPSKTGRNLVLAVIVEALVNCVLYVIFENVSAVYSEKYNIAVEEAVHAAPVLTAKELYASAGPIAYYNEILSAVIILIAVIEIVCLIIASKKLADKRLNVL
jgi:hypothetical protein